MKLLKTSIRFVAKGMVVTEEDEVKCCLRRLRLEQYEEAVVGHGFDTMERLSQLTTEDMYSIGFKMGHCRWLQFNLGLPKTPMATHDSTTLSAFCHKSACPVDASISRFNCRRADGTSHWHG